MVLIWPNFKLEIYNLQFLKSKFFCITHEIISLLEKDSRPVHTEDRFLFSTRCALLLVVSLTVSAMVISLFSSGSFSLRSVSCNVM